MGYAFLRIAEPDSSDLAVVARRHREPPLPRPRRSRGRRPPRILRQGARATTSPARIRAGAPGQYVYETVDSKDGRLAIANIDFSHPDFFVGSKNTPFVRRTADKVEIGAPKIEEGRASITVRITAPGVSSASVTYALDAGTKSLAIDWTLEKLHHEDPEAVFVAFPFKLDKPRFTIDLNGIPSAPNDDQLDGAAKDWYPLQRWVDVSDGRRGVTLVPARRAARPSRRHHHRQVGAAARAGGPDDHVVGDQQSLAGQLQGEPGRPHPAPLPADHACRRRPIPRPRRASRRKLAVPPIVLRDIAPTGARSDSFFSVDPGSPVLVTAKPGEEEGWIALRLQNLSRAKARPTLTFTKAPAAARRSDPIEHARDALGLDGRKLGVDLEPLAIATVLVRFAP